MNPASLLEITYPRALATLAVASLTQRGSDAGDEEDAEADIVFVIEFQSSARVARKVSNQQLPATAQQQQRRVAREGHEAVVQLQLGALPLTPHCAL